MAMILLKYVNHVIFLAKNVRIVQIPIAHYATLTIIMRAHQFVYRIVDKDFIRMKFQRFALLAKATVESAIHQ